ncbi:MAG: S-layer homology domain-containing protein, partial [Oscillospiraceae bacterium]|nr:S-layer homology domain-containing protein [Oscillospiraceae bacterium]
MKKLISLLLAAVILLSLGTAAFASEIQLPVYADVAKGSWYEGYVNQMVKAGLMNGVSAEKFDPNGTLSREMFVTILYRAAGKPATGKASSFVDVVKGTWSADGVDWASSNGVVNGVTSLNFAPKDSLTREQMVTILYRWSKAEKVDAAALDAFPDKGDVSAYAVDAFAWAVKNNVIGGKNGKLEPKGTTTRAEACAVLARYLDTVAPTREDLEKAVVASAWAHFAKVGKLQYCSEVITELSKFYGGQYRLSEGAVPEDGTSDTTIYSVCSDFCCKTFTDGIGIRVFDSPDYLDAITAMFWSLSDSYGTTLIRYANDSYEISGEAQARGMTRDSFSTADETKAFISNWKENLRPGDVMVWFVPGGGHALLYVGDGYLIDCRGSKYNMTSGAEAPEPQGAVYLLYKIEDVLVNGTDPNWSSYTIDKLDRFTAVRPINQLLQDDGDGNPANDKLKNGFWTIPAKTFTREQYPLLDIDRTVNITPFGTAYTGEELTYSVKLKNYSDCDVYKTVCERSGDSPKDYTGLRVTERVPAGTELVPGSITNGGTAENGVITWNVNVPKGQTAEVSYKVKVTAFQGEMIVSNGGFVGDIPSNTIKTYVGGAKLSAEA